MTGTRTSQLATGSDPGSGPRYAQLSKILIAEIAQGEFPVGTTLPTEVQLSERFAVSRATVRSALDEVQRIGLVSRRPRRGTRVERRQPAGDYAPSLRTLAQLMQYAEETRREILHLVECVADERLADELSIDRGHVLLKVEMIRVHADTAEPPICWTEVFLDTPTTVEVRRAVRSSAGLLCEAVGAVTGSVVTSVEQVIRPVVLDADRALLLRSDVGAPALEITRRYLDHTGRVFQLSVSTHPAGRFQYRSTLSLR